MKNKWLKKGILLAVIGCFAFSMAGCKGEAVMDKLLSKADEKQEEVQKKEIQEEKGPKVDVVKPELTTNLSGSVSYKIGDTAEPLKIEATVSDGGTLTYQWYQTSTKTTGGGTLIEGATDSTYTPSTKEAGIMYYYVVATNNIGSSSNGITSEAVEVIVTEEGESTEQKEEKTEEKTQEQPAQ